MLLSRRQLLAALSAGSTAVALSGCRSIEQVVTPFAIQSDLPVDRPTMSLSDAERILGRAGYGHRPGDRSYLQQVGLAAFIEQQLNPNQIPENPVLEARYRGLEDLIPNDYGLLYEQDDHVLIDSLSQATLLRAVYTNRGLFERMVEFWSDHFSIFPFKSICLPQYLVLFNLNVIRPNALGTLRTLLGACAHSAALLSYLDNDKNRAGRPNENFARELMELHTLGIHGGYTQGDIENVARCLTGSTINTGMHPGQYQFDFGSHDSGSKSLLSAPIVSSGRDELDEVLDRLAAHRSTARHLSTKLLRRFRGDAKPEHIELIADVYSKTDGNIKSMLRALFLECGVFDAPPILKRPMDFAVSALRAVDADTDCNADVVESVAKMGQPLFHWPRPDGFPDGSRAWANCLSARWQFALDLCAGSISNTSVDWSQLAPTGSAQEIFRRIFSTSPSRSAISFNFAIDATAIGIRQYASFALMSPEFQYR